VIDTFWILVDSDGNGEIDIDEYTELSLNLQQSMWETEQAKKKGRRKNAEKFNEEEGIANAKREWQLDSQGFEFLDYNRFQLCFFQIADAWSTGGGVSSYVKVLNTLLAQTSKIVHHGAHKGTRVWKWAHGDDASTEDKDPKPAAKVSVSEIEGAALSRRVLLLSSAACPPRFSWGSTKYLLLILLLLLPPPPLRSRRSCRRRARRARSASPGR
jgi:hypothetical protein